MKNVKKLIVIGLLLIAVILIIACHDSSAEHQGNDINKQPEIPTVVIPEQCDEGIVTVKDETGNALFQYDGSIDILNSGRNGEPIDIVITVSSEENGYE